MGGHGGRATGFSWSRRPGLAAGLFGYALIFFRFPVAPVVLGVILAPLADENLRRTLMLFDRRGMDYALDQWIENILLAGFVLLIVEGIWRGRRNQRRATAGL